MSNITTSQTIGPFFHEALKWANHAGTGEIALHGQVLDGDGVPITDAMIEAWIDGVKPVNGIALWRQPTDNEGRFALHLPQPATDTPLAHICIFARGMLNHHFTAVFLYDANHTLLKATPSQRRSSLIAKRIDELRYEWTIRMQGDTETVFFEYE